ncbi:MAG: ABC transporter substrate-binding protein [Reyranellaceae bacterium]
MKIRMVVRALAAMSIMAVALPAVPAAAQDISIGVIVPLTGPAAPQGHAVKTAIEMAAAEINAAKGIGGRKINVIVRDDQGQPANAVNIAQDFIQKERLNFVVGPTLSSSALAVAPLFTRAKVVALALVGAADWNKPAQYPYAFQVLYSNDLVAKAAVSYAIDTLGRKKFGQIGDTSAYALGGMADTRKVISEMGGEVVGQEKHNMGDLDYSVQLQRLKDAGANVLNLWTIAPTDVVRIIRKIQEMKWTDLYHVGPANIGLQPVLDGLGRDAYPKTFYYVCMRNMTHGNAKAEAYGKKYAAARGKIDFPLYYSAIAYDSVYMLKAAIEGSAADPDKVKQWLESNSYQGVAATYAAKPNDHQMQTVDMIGNCSPLNYKDGLDELVSK